MALALKQTHKPKEQNQEPRNKSKHINLTNIWQGNQEYVMENTDVKEWNWIYILYH